MAVISFPQAPPEGESNWGYLRALLRTRDCLDQAIVEELDRLRRQHAGNQPLNELLDTLHDLWERTDAPS